MAEQRVAIVTGGASGIGAAIVRRLCEDGLAVAICDLQEEAARDLATELTDAGPGRAIAVRMDVTDGEAIRTGVAKIESELGPVAILVNNAGWDKVEPFVNNSEETWDRILAINLKGQIACARAVLEGMIESHYGRIVNIASDAGRVGSTGETVYAAAKGGVIAFTKSLAREMARYEIAVNCICPGPTDTPLFATISEGNPRLGEALQRAIPMRRLGQPQDIAPAVSFLVSEEAGYITGQTLSVSGGLTMA